MYRRPPSDSTIVVKVKYLAATRDQAGTGEDQVTLPAGASLRDLACYLKERRGLSLPQSDVIATLNGRGWEQAPQGLDTPLQPGDIVHLFPPIAGG